MEKKDSPNIGHNKRSLLNSPVEHIDIKSFFKTRPKLIAQLCRRCFMLIVLGLWMYNCFSIQIRRYQLDPKATAPEAFQNQLILSTRNFHVAKHCSCSDLLSCVYLLRGDLCSSSAYACHKSTCHENTCAPSMKVATPSYADTFTL